MRSETFSTRDGSTRGGAKTAAAGGAPSARRRLVVLVLSALITIGVFAADYGTGAEISFSFIYLLPVAVATWFSGLRAGLLFSALSAGAWVTSYFLAGRFYSEPRILVWNAAVELATFVTVALTLWRVRIGIERERALTRQAERAWTLLDREEQRVGQLQRSLLPARAPELPGYSIVVHYATSTRAGGDYYDFFTLPSGPIGLLVADASGHGTPAAVVMAMMRALLHAAPETLAAPEHALASLNARLCGNVPPGSFATACYATLDPATGQIAYALGGHPPPLLARGQRAALESLTSFDGLPLGISPGASFSRGRARLQPGDTLLLFTDGLVEAMNAEGECFGEERVRSLLLEHRLAAPETICRRLIEALASHVGPRPATDDVTAILVRAA